MHTVANKRLQHNISKIFREWAPLEDFARNPTRSCDKVPYEIFKQAPLGEFHKIVTEAISTGSYKDHQRSLYDKNLNEHRKWFIQAPPARPSRSSCKGVLGAFTMTSAGPPQKGPLNAMTSGNILRGRCYNHRITATTAIQHAPSDERVASWMSKWAQRHNESNLTRTEWREGWVSHIKCAPRRNESDPTRAKHARVMQANGSISLNIAAGAAKTKSWICENRCFYWLQATLSSGPPKMCLLKRRSSANSDRACHTNWGLAAPLRCAHACPHFGSGPWALRLRHGWNSPRQNEFLTRMPALLRLARKMYMLISSSRKHGGERTSTIDVS